MSDHQDPAGMAALSICEALLLALNDRNLLPEQEVVGILRDAAATHANDLINEIIEGGNLSRRS